MTMSDLVVVMNEGVVQQIGTPEEVYGRPANLFVAGFIGTPPMNLVPARWQGGTLRVVDTPLPVALPAAAPADVILGIRPQDVAIVPAGTPGSIPGKVWVAELLGSERLIEVELAPKLRMTRWCARATAPRSTMRWPPAGPSHCMCSIRRPVRRSAVRADPDQVDSPDRGDAAKAKPGAVS